MKHIGADEQAFIIGGASVYKEGLAIADRLFLTEIDATPKHADVFFPEFDNSTWEIEKKEEHSKTEKSLAFAFVDYIRKKDK